MKTLIFLATFASVTLYLPNAGQTVLGAATMTAKVNDVVKVGVYVDQADAGLTELQVAIPYLPGSLEYVRLEGEGLTANNIIVNDSAGSVNVKWTGTVPAGDARHLGYVVFRVRKADKTTFQGRGVNPFARDADGAQISDVDVIASAAIVQLSPRPLRVELDLVVE